MLDLTFETASRVLSALRRDGVVEVLDSRSASLSMPHLLAALNEEGRGR